MNNTRDLMAMALLGALTLTGCQQLDSGTAGSGVETGTGRDEGSTPYGLGRSNPFQRAGMSDANIASGRAEAAMDVSPAGAAELSRRSAAATIEGPNRETTAPSLTELESASAPRTADDALLDRIRQALASPEPGASDLRTFSIQTLNNMKLHVADGVVTLRGNVGTPQECRDIEALIHRVEGVKNVVNQLQVVPSENRPSTP